MILKGSNKIKNQREMENMKKWKTKVVLGAVLVNALAANFAFAEEGDKLKAIELDKAKPKICINGENDMIFELPEGIDIKDKFTIINADGSGAGVDIEGKDDIVIDLSGEIGTDKDFNMIDIEEPIWKKLIGKEKDIILDLPKGSIVECEAIDATHIEKSSKVLRRLTKWTRLNGMMDRLYKK